MMGFIEGIPILDFAPATLLGIAILMRLGGKLWTNSAYREKCKEADLWRLAYERERDNREQADGQAELALEQGKTMQALLEAILQNTEEIRKKAGDSHV